MQPNDFGKGTNLESRGNIVVVHAE